MALRFIDTNYFKSPFVKSLKAPLKLLQNYIICDCSGAGIWTKDLEIAAIYIGEKITDEDFNIFVTSGKALDLKNGKYFFPDFIEHQYPKGLSNTNPAHINVIVELKKYNLIDEYLNIKKELASSLEGTIVMVKDMDMEKVINENNFLKNEIAKLKKELDKKDDKNKIPNFEEFYNYLKEYLSEEKITINQSLDRIVKTKYDSWIENGWKDLKGSKISNWKAKIKTNSKFWVDEMNRSNYQLPQTINKQSQITL